MPTFNNRDPAWGRKLASSNTAGDQIRVPAITLDAARLR